MNGILGQLTIRSPLRIHGKETRHMWYKLLRGAAAFLLGGGLIGWVVWVEKTPSDDKWVKEFFFMYNDFFFPSKEIITTKQMCCKNHISYQLA